jgi:hypothetical protein
MSASLTNWVLKQDVKYALHAKNIENMRATHESIMYFRGNKKNNGRYHTLLSGKGRNKGIHRPESAAAEACARFCVD